MKTCTLYIEGLGAERALDKLAQAGIPVLFAKKTQKNAITVGVDGKHRKKVFAILKSSCYNIKKAEYRGTARFARACVRNAGLLVGAAVFCLLVSVFQNRVLSVRVTGSGAYLESAVTEILEECGVKTLSTLPAEKSALTEKVLSLPRVSFCSVKLSGGILTVDVEVSDDGALLSAQPLVAPVAGRVEEITAVRGTPLCFVGDGVNAGDIVVANYAPSGEGTRLVVVIARVTIAYPVSELYALSEEEAKAQAFLDHGAITDLSVTNEEGGVRISGTARVCAAINLE